MYFSDILQISLMHFTALQLAAPPRHYPLPPLSIVRFWHQICPPPLLFLCLVKSQFNAAGPALHLHRCLPRQFIHTLLIPQPTAHTRHHQSIGPRCGGRLLIFSVVLLRRCGLQAPDAVLPALLSIIPNSQTPRLPDLPLSPSFPVHLSTTTPSNSHVPSLLLLQASL